MRIVSTSKEVKCHLWPDGKLCGIYKSNETQNNTINTVSWAKDGGWMVLVPENGKTEIISFYNDPKLIHTIQGIQNTTCACFQTSTKYNIALGTSTGQLLIYDTKSRSVKKTFPYAPASLFKLQYNYKGSHLIAGCDNGKVYVYNNHLGILSSSIKVPHSKTLTNFKCHPSMKNYMAGCSEEGIVSVLDINTSKSVVHSELHRAPVNDIIFSTLKSSLIVSLGMDSIICFYDYRANRLAHSLGVPKTPLAVDVSPNGDSVAVGSQDGKIVLYDLRNLKESIFKFEHGSRIKQILFENVSDDLSSVMELSQPEEAQTKPKNETNSFGNLIFGQAIPDIQEVKPDTKDSFLEAIGFHSPNLGGQTQSKNETNSFGKVIFGQAVSDTQEFKLDGLNSQASPGGQIQTLPIKNLTDSKPNRSPSPVPVAESKSHLKTQVDHFISRCHLASTPVAGDKQDLFSNISPIPMVNNNLNKDELRTVIREVVREEMEVFKKELRYQTWDLLGSVRKYTMDLKLMTIKEFAIVEDKVKGIRKELSEDD